MKTELSVVLIVLLFCSVLFSGKTTLISRKQAQRDALSAVGGGNVTFALKEKELGKIIWSVGVTNATREFEVWVDAHSGTVLQVVAGPRIGD